MRMRRMGFFALSNASMIRSGLDSRANRAVPSLTGPPAPLGLVGPGMPGLPDLAWPGLVSLGRLVGISS